MARIYTRTGDAGTTRLSDGSEVPKTHPRLEACGTLDELNSHLGVVRAVNQDPEMDALLARIQLLLFEVGSDLASPKPAALHVTEEDVAWLEQEIDRATGECPPLKAFVLPGGTLAASHLHVARTVCRRAERLIVALAEAVPMHPPVLRFVNRLSDLLFALARLANTRAGAREVLWKPRAAS